MDTHTQPLAARPFNTAAFDVGLLLLRIVAGTIFMAHGAQKVFGMFDGPGLAKVVEGMGNIGYLVAIGEFFGGLGILAGLFSRFSAFWLIIIMLGAIVKVHGAKGFFSQGGGYEYNLALIGLMIPILLMGPGRISFANLLPFLRSKRTGQPPLAIE
jgi:putative oxidoreductase